MKKLLIFFILLSNYSFAQTYTWAVTDTNYQSYDGAYSCLAKDSSGNLFVAYAHKRNFVYADYIAVIKYDSSRNIVWTHKIESYWLGSLGVGLCTDASGNVYVTSTFTGDLFFDSTLCASIYGGNMFLIKMNTSGEFQWVRHSSGGQAWSSMISSDTQNNVYVGGYVNGDVYFDTVFIHTGLTYNYVAKYNSDGQFQWVKYPTGASFAGFANFGMATDHSGNTYIAGTASGSANFDSISISALGWHDIYLAKIDTHGNWLWAVNAGGSEDDALEGRGLAIDNNGGVYITGFIGSPTANFGGIILTVSDAPNSDYFIAKYNTAGNAVWAVNGGGIGDQSGKDICVDSYGNSYVKTSGKFLSKYDNNGNFLWAQTKPVANLAMLSDNAGSIYITGYFNYTINFDSFTLSANAPQMYIAQLYDPPAITTNLPKLKYDNGLSVYPNPASGIVTLNYVSTKPKDTFTLNISNIIGQNVYSENLKEISTSCTKQINLSFLPKGIYYLELNSNSPDSPQRKEEVKKIVLQ